MYQRKANQGYGNESKRNMNHQMQGSYGSMSHDMQGNYQGSQMQQSNYKPSMSPNPQGMKQQQQQAQKQAHMRPPSNMPLSGKSQQQAQQSSPSQQQQQQQQHQQQHHQQHQQQQHQQQQQHHQQQQSQSHSAQPLAQRLKPILKNSTASAPTAAQNTSAPPSALPPPVPALSSVPPPPPPPGETDNQEGMKSDKRDAEQQDGHPRWRRKIPGFKVNKKLKRLRMNQRLRKTLQPKNAIMVLNEMKAGVQFTYPETQMTNSGDKFSLYVVHAELDGKTYVGQGLSKPQARQNAAENALKGLLLEKMTVASMKARIDAESDGQSDTRMDSESDGQLDEKSNNSEMKEENTDDSNAMDTTNAEDEIPWSSLASFALYKLFLEWHNQGTSVPVPRPGLPAGKGSKRDNSITRPQVQKELPPNPTNIHPVMLLNQVRPGLTYVEVSRSGNPPNTMFTLAVDVNGTEYSGTAKNKKDAKKIAAKAALSALYGLTYPEDTKEESMDVQ